jgi:hypothetical protein
MVLASLAVAVAVDGLVWLRPRCTSSEARPSLVDGRLLLGDGCVVGCGTSRLDSSDGLGRSLLPGLDGLVGGDGGA